MPVRLTSLLVLLIFAAWPVSAQEPTPAPITANNITQLAPSASIDFDDLPPEAGVILSGGFALNASGSLVALRNRDNGIVTFDGAGKLVDVFSVTGADGLPDTVLDMAFNREGSLLAAIASDGAAYTVALRLLDEQVTALQPLPFAPDIPLRVWFDGDTPSLWLELSPADPGESPYVAQLPYALPGQIADNSQLETVPFGPDADPETFARFGRIGAPYAVTSTQAGRISVWNLETADILAQAQVEGLPVFGGLNRDATALAWRDPDYTELHLLDLTTGEDRLVALLDGTYINYILVTPPADLILGIHVGDEPIIAAWDTATGERIDVGAYRQCVRTPDMARLSGNGAVVVIGCDSGVDIWRVMP